MKDKKLKDKEVKNKREIVELFLRLIVVSIDDVDKFEEKEMKKIRPIKNPWYDWLTNCIPEPIRKSVGCFKDKVITLFKTNTSKQTVHGRGKKLNKSKTQKQSEEHIINSIRSPFIQK